MSSNEKAKKKKETHPSLDLVVRGKGYGIAAGYEKSYKKTVDKDEETGEKYGPIPHSGYYGSGLGLRPFKAGQASFDNEKSWYSKQYGVETGRKSQIKGKS
jgi:hypothetical protein